MIDNLIGEIFRNETTGKETASVSRISYGDTGERLVEVGHDGVTKITLYRENGQMEYVPWAAVYRGDFLRARIDLAGKIVEYQEVTNG